MKKLIIIVIALSGASGFVHAQQIPRIDSLSTVLTKCLKEDTTKVNLLIELCELNISTNVEVALNHAKNALEISERIQYKRGKATSLNRMANCIERQSNMTLANEYYERSMSLFRALEDEAGVARNLYGLGYSHYVLAKPDQSIDYLDQAFKIYTRLGDDKMAAICLLVTGWTYTDQGNYALGLEQLLTALPLHQKMANTGGVMRTYEHIGVLHGKLENYSEALGYFNKALTLAEDTDDISGVSSLLSRIGAIHNLTGKFEKALEYQNKALLISQDIKSNSGITNQMHGIAKAYFGLGDYDQALIYALEAKQIKEKYGIVPALEEIYSLIGRIYLKKKNYIGALEYTNKGLEVAHQEKTVPQMVAAYLYLSNIHSALGNYQKAYESHVQYKILNDSVVNKDNIQKVTNLEAQYKFDEEKEEIRIEQEKKDLLTERQILQAELERNYLFAGVLFVLLLAGAIARAYYSRKKAADVLRKLNDEIAQVNQKLKMTDTYRTRFFANINHDIRTPLTLIRGYHEQIIRDENNYLSNGSEKHLRYLKKNTDTLYHMSQEIQNLTLLDESKLSLSWQAVEIVSLTQSLTNMFHSRADLERKSISCVDLPSEEITVHLDRAQFERILGNMLSNAFKYSDEGAEVTVSCKTENEMLYFEVTDTGYGISEEHLPFIFDRFYQTADNPYKTQQGVGLGLALVKELVVLHGGELFVVSTFGEGSTFSFSLPYNLDKEVSISSEEAMSHLPGTETVDHAEAVNLIVEKDAKDKTHTVLVVDDHEEIRDYIVSIIGAQYHIKQAAHGRQALELMGKEVVDLVITDLMMPWLDGFELVEQMQENEKLKHIPVMVVSARTTEEDKMKILSSGVNEFMSKPFSPVEMEQRLENMLSQKDSNDVWSHLSKDKELRSNLEEDILNKVHALVLKKIDDGNLTVAVLAAELCASERKVHDLINSLTGMAPKTYIRSIRLEYAKHLIDSKKVSNASEAAQSIGMNNSTQFKNQYVKKYGVGPFD